MPPEGSKKREKEKDATPPASGSAEEQGKTRKVTIGAFSSLVLQHPSSLAAGNGLSASFGLGLACMTAESTFPAAFAGKPTRTFLLLQDGSRLDLLTGLVLYSLFTRHAPSILNGGRGYMHAGGTGIWIDPITFVTRCSTPIFVLTLVQPAIIAAPSDKRSVVELPALSPPYQSTHSHFFSISASSLT